MHSHYERIWIAVAPDGVWSSGPEVILDIPGSDAVEAYRRMGWTVYGPYILEQKTEAA